MDNNNIQAGLANINAKAELNTELKAADNIHTQIGGTTNYNNDNSQIINQNYEVTILQHIDCSDAIIKALSHGNENAKMLNDDLKILLDKNGISNVYIQEKMKNPELLYTIAKANEIAYITNDIERRKILADLIYNKFVTEDDENSIILSQAITIMKNLTKSHLKIIAFLYLFQSNYVKNNTNSKNFIEFYNKYIANLIDIPFNKLQELGINIIGNGVVVSFTFAWDITSYLPKSFYDELTGKLYDIPIDIKSKIGHLDSIWKELATSSSKLTSVGKCIGKTYLHDILGLEVIENNNQKNIEVPQKEDIVTKNDLGEIFDNTKITTWEEIKAEE